MIGPDRRMSVRQSWRLSIILQKPELGLSFDGVSVNVSQRGAFINTKNWQCFQVEELTTVTCILPPHFTGQNQPISLQGAATVRRVDQINEAVAVEFMKRLKQFEPLRDKS